MYIDKSPEYRLFEPWLGNGLLISTGKHYYVHTGIRLTLEVYKDFQKCRGIIFYIIAEIDTRKLI